MVGLAATCYSWGKEVPLPLHEQPRHDRVESLEAYVERASQATAVPPEPAGGIPKQWVPFWVRWPIRALVLPFVVLDQFVQRLARVIVRPPWKQVGHCYQRGNCCHYLLMSKPVGWKKPLLGLYLWWNTQINGFFLRDQEAYDHDGEEMLVMGCRYLQKDGRCGHYRWRPTVCRQWPLIEYWGVPRRLKGCGFRAVPRERQDKKGKLRIIK